MPTNPPDAAARIDPPLLRTKIVGKDPNGKYWTFELVDYPGGTGLVLPEGWERAYHLEDS